MQSDSATTNQNAIADVKRLLETGDLAWHRGEAESALANWTSALERVGEIGDADDDALVEAHCDLLLRVGRLRLAQGWMNEAQDDFERMMRQAEESGHVEYLATAQAWLGRVARRRRDFDTALALIERAMQLAKTLPPGRTRQRIRAMMLYEQGAIALNRGDNPAALAALRESQSLYRQAGDLTGEAACLTFQGTLYHYMSLPDQAWAQFEAASALYEQDSGNPAGRLSHQLAWGAAHESCEQYREAMAHYRAALDTAHRLGAERNRATCLNNIAVIRKKEGDYEEALALYWEALDLFRDLQDRRGVAVVLNNVGAVHVARDEGERALSVLETARQMTEEADFQPMLSETYALLSAAQRLVGRPLVAFEHAERALRMAEEIGNMERAAVAYRALGMAVAALEHQGRLPPTALAGGPRAYFTTGLEILEQLGRIYERARTLQALGEYLSASSDPARQAEGKAYLEQATECFASVGIPVESP